VSGCLRGIIVSIFFGNDLLFYPKTNHNHDLCPPCNCPTNEDKDTITDSATTMPLIFFNAIWSGLVYFASTLEVLFRGFSLGFGIRMLKDVLLQHDQDLSHIRERLWIAAFAGLAMATFIYGTSLFVPARYRMNWFEV
jgi:hypothetical protein